MNLRKQTVAVVLALFTATSLVCAQEDTSPSPNSTTNGSIVGTWVVTRHGVDCSTGSRLGPDFPALMTFNLGGTLNAYAIPPNGTTPATTSPEYGTWSKVASNRYQFRDISYSYDGNGTFTGSGVIKAVVILDNDADSFTYKSKISFYDASGNLQFSICGQATGKRF